MPVNTPKPSHLTKIPFWVRPALWPPATQSWFTSNRWGDMRSSFITELWHQPTEQHLMINLNFNFYFKHELFGSEADRCFRFWHPNSYLIQRFQLYKTMWQRTSEVRVLLQLLWARGISLLISSIPHHKRSAHYASEAVSRKRISYLHSSTSKWFSNLLVSRASVHSYELSRTSQNFVYMGYIHQYLPY